MTYCLPSVQALLISISISVRRMTLLEPKDIPVAEQALVDTR